MDPGEKLVQSLAQFASSRAIGAAAVISGVGMLSHIELGLFDVEIDDYRRTAYEGIFDLSMILGNIVQRGGEAVPHVHAVFNDPAHVTYILTPNGNAGRRVRPASRLVAHNAGSFDEG